MQEIKSFRIATLSPSPVASRPASPTSDPKPTDTPVFTQTVQVVRDDGYYINARVQLDAVILNPLAVARHLPSQLAAWALWSSIKDETILTLNKGLFEEITGYSLQDMISCDKLIKS